MTLNNRNLLFHRFRGRKFETEVSAASVPLSLRVESFLASSLLLVPALRPWHSMASSHIAAVSALSSHGVLPVCLCLRMVFSSSYKETSRIGLGPTLMTSFNFSHQSKSSVSKYRHIQKYWGIRASAIKFWRDTIEPRTGKVKDLVKQVHLPSRPGFPGVWDDWRLMLTFGWAVWGDYNNGEKCEREHFTWGRKRAV